MPLALKHLVKNNKSILTLNELNYHIKKFSSRLEPDERLPNGLHNKTAMNLIIVLLLYIDMVMFCAIKNAIDCHILPCNKIRNMTLKCGMTLHEFEKLNFRPNSPTLDLWIFWNMVLWALLDSPDLGTLTNKWLHLVDHSINVKLLSINHDDWDIAAETVNHCSVQANIPLSSIHQACENL